MLHFLGIFIHFYGSNAWILMKNIRCFYLKTGFPHNSLCIFRVPHRLLTPTLFPFNTTNSDKKHILTIISVFTFSVYNKYTCGGIFNSAMICSGFEMIHVAPLHRAEFASLNPADTLSQCKYVQSQYIGLVSICAHTASPASACVPLIYAAACCFSALARVAAQLPAV